MAVDSNFASLFEKLKVEDPWLPPRTWESIPSESGDGGPRSLSHLSSSSQSQPLYDASTLSEESMVRLAMYALQGVKSALISIEKLSAAFCSDPTDRTFHQIPSLWNRSSSTHALGKILNSIGCSGSLVFLLHQFVDYFTNLNSDESLMGKREISEPAENQIYGDSEVHDKKCRPYSLVNQAFAAAVGKVLEGYMCALDTLYASVGFRHSSRKVGMHASYMVGCFTSVVHSEITLLELYLHTKELRTWIEALGNICNLHNVALCFSTSSFEHLSAKATSGLCNFYKGGDLLTYLYKLLQVADPAHRAVLKFLFHRSCEPYCGFIRSWIFKAEISDPYGEFIVEYANNIPPNPHGKAGISVDFPLSNIRERDAVAIPCFLKDFLIPLVRAGQQVQVIMKLLELYVFVSTGDHTYEDFLPCWSGFSSSYPSYTSPVTFCKANVEAMVLARDSYYKMIQEKLEYLLAKLEFRYDQVVSNCTEPLSFDTDGGCSHNQVSFLLDDSLIAPSAASRRGSNVYDYSSSMDELSFVMDTSESSECLSSSGSDEQIESEMLIEPPNHVVGLETKYLSAISFSSSMSTDITLQKPHLFRSSSDKENDSQRICELKYGLGHDARCHHKGVLSSHIFDSGESHGSSTSDIEHTFTLPDKAYSQGSLPKQSFSEGYGGKSRFHPADSEKKLRKRYVGVIREGPSYFSEILGNLDASMEQAENSTSTSYSYTLQWQNPAYHSNFLSMNPMLTNYAFLHLMGKSGERCSTAYGQSLPYFDFSSVENPCKLCVERSAANSGCDFGSELQLPLDLHASSTSSKNDHYCNQENDHGLIDNMEVCNVYSPLDSKCCNQDIIESGCSDWKAMFGSSSDTFNSSVQCHRQNLSFTFEIPLDFIIEKCIQQEIMLQYKYISKLTIKLFEEGFNLQEHFLALRRYHFMEIADWADLFIKSLWDHPQKCVTKADQRLSAIQAFLEASVQRSSCEQDRYKDRLFVYMKGHGTMPLSTSSIGVRSFKFLGLGYRVDWPISIVLTPGALEIYADIFSFLIQVKLAVFSLASVWCSLKDLVHLINRKPTSEHHENEVSHLHKLMKLRHQVNHFISTLQQYVESQLSHVSWCRFLDSLHNKVKDMLDLESLHMAYLMDCLHICFLSDETRHVASIIENILQCALDFRSCLTGGICGVGMDQEDLMGTFSRINISQVLAIKQTFNKNLNELHLCYLKSPKHGEFGLSCFWAYLNYNEYYSDDCNHMPVVMSSR
ncbi:uncharacterized protein LOC121239342 isoform X1 [Juglans microcarpa x Juglans regia]|uniref:uncharacterized protein LOC121239342 isoform X1 n=1 Tax=Juglans microcarpa x Juglans regia TaxID=2249226 RepID=UPI001B7D9121|nr:uncharacterized protein LOC121239342 isoform X1 [Juglans microcarpa x Juglans regia]